MRKRKRKEKENKEKMKENHCRQPHHTCDVHNHLLCHPRLNLQPPFPTARPAYVSQPSLICMYPRAWIYIYIYPFLPTEARLWIKSSNLSETKAPLYPQQAVKSRSPTAWRGYRGTLQINSDSIHLRTVAALLFPFSLNVGNMERPSSPALQLS